MRSCASVLSDGVTENLGVLKRPIAPVVFYRFDLLWSDGRDVTGTTVLQRRDRLEQVIKPVPGIQVGGYLENCGIDLYRLAKEKGLEAIIAKRKTSTYRPGKRSSDWLKIRRSRHAIDFIVPCGSAKTLVAVRFALLNQPWEEAFKAATHDCRAYIRALAVRTLDISVPGMD